jgi:hypothetical protein
VRERYDEWEKTHGNAHTVYRTTVYAQQHVAHTDAPARISSAACHHFVDHTQALLPLHKK